MRSLEALKKIVKAPVEELVPFDCALSAFCKSFPKLVEDPRKKPQMGSASCAVPGLVAAPV